MNSSDTGQSVEQSAKGSDFAHLAWLAVGVALASVPLYAMVKASRGAVEGGFFGCILVCFAFTTVFVGSVWAVFGPGSYLKRLFWSYLLCTVAGLGHLAAITMILPPPGLDDGYFLRPVQYFLLGIAPVSLAAQIPMWFFRFFFGWQLTLGDSPPAESFSLRDIFVFTLLVAIGFAGPQMAVKLANNSDWFDPATTTEAVTLPDGTVTWEEVVATDQEVIDKRIRDFEKRNRFNVLAGYGGVAAWGFGISLLSLPVPLFIFRSKNGGAGCGLTAAYAFGWLILIAITVSTLSPSLPGEILGLFGVFPLAYAGLVAIVFAASRGQGFRLTSPRRFRREATVADKQRAESV